MQFSISNGVNRFFQFTQLTVPFLIKYPVIQIVITDNITAKKPGAVIPETFKGEAWPTLIKKMMTAVTRKRSNPTRINNNERLIALCSERLLSSEHAQSRVAISQVFFMIGLPLMLEAGGG